jgi:hypothetical protein
MVHQAKNPITQVTEKHLSQAVETVIAPVAAMKPA